MQEKKDEKANRDKEQSLLEYRRQQRKLATTVGSVSPPNDRRSFASGSPSQKGGYVDASAVQA